MRSVLASFLLILAFGSNVAAQAIMPLGAPAAEQAQAPSIPDNLSDKEAFDFFVGLNDAEARALLLEEWRRERQEAGAGKAGPSGLAVIMVRLRLWLETNLTLIGRRADMVSMAAPDAPGFAFQTLRSALTGQPSGFLTTWTAVGLALLASFWSGRSLGPVQRNFGRKGDGFAGTFLFLLLRLALVLVPATLFALITIGVASLTLKGSAKALMSGALTAAALIAATGAILELVLSPQAPQSRLLPVGDRTARRLKGHAMMLVSVGAGFWTVSAFLILSGRPPLGVHLTFVLISGAAVFLTAAHMVWRLREPVADHIRDAGDSPFLPKALRPALAERWHLLLLGYLGIVGLFWSFAMLTDRPSILWPAVGTLVVVAGLQGVDALFRSTITWLVMRLSLQSLPELPTHESDEGGGPIARTEPVDPEAYIDLFSRAARFLLMVLAVLTVLQFWGVDVLMLFGAPGAASLWQVAGEICVILIVAYIAWQVVETAVTRGFVRRVSEDEQEQLRIAARARTLLPLVRTFLLAMLVVVVVMVILSSLGVDIGPLIAGAGVVGIAIGFGAQTLVRDIVSGVFFLLDDAFRLGEYIEMDPIRGEVEAITLRSLRLRHHRGHIFTVPFSELRYVINYNRDWVIYKMPIRVPPDTEPALVKRIIKQIGKDLLADPELGPKFIEPLKSQGVYAIDDDSALIIRVKFMCKPRQQFVIRREAYHLIRRRFAEHGIEFARRKVEVSVPEGDKPVSEQVAAGVAEAAGLPRAGSDSLGQ